MGMKDKLQTLLDNGQDNALLRFSLGEIHHHDGEMAAAISHLAEAVRQDPAYSAAWKLYGRALLDAGEIERARDTLTEGIAVATRRGDNQAAREMQVFLKRARRAQDAEPR